MNLKVIFSCVKYRDKYIGRVKRVRCERVSCDKHTKDLFHCGEHLYLQMERSAYELEVFGALSYCVGVDTSRI